MHPEENIEEVSFVETDKSHLLEVAFSKYGKQVFSLAYSFVKNKSLAEDVTQEVFFKVFRNIDSFKGKSSLKTWLYRITINQCKDTLKTNYIKSFLPLFHNESSIENFENQLIRDEESEELIQKISTLPQKYKEVLILFYFQDLHISEISEILKVNENTVKTRMLRARSLLKKKYAGRDLDGR